MHARLSPRMIFPDLAFFSERENITYFGSVLRLPKMEWDTIAYFSESRVSKPHSHLSHPPHDATSRALLSHTAQRHNAPAPTPQVSHSVAG